MLKNKTRILVTHGITYLPHTDKIFVLKDGEVSESGTYHELLDKKGSFAEFLVQHIQEHDEDEEGKFLFIQNSKVFCYIENIFFFDFHAKQDPN